MERRGGKNARLAVGGRWPNTEAVSKWWPLDIYATIFTDNGSKCMHCQHISVQYLEISVQLGTEMHINFFFPGQQPQFNVI